MLKTETIQCIALDHFDMEYYSIRAHSAYINVCCVSMDMYLKQYF